MTTIVYMVVYDEDGTTSLACDGNGRQVFFEQCDALWIRDFLQGEFPDNHYYIKDVIL